MNNCLVPVAFYLEIIISFILKDLLSSWSILHILFTNSSSLKNSSLQRCYKYMLEKRKPVLFNNGAVKTGDPYVAK